MGPAIVVPYHSVGNKVLRRMAVPHHHGHRGTLDFLGDAVFRLALARHCLVPRSWTPTATAWAPWHSNPIIGTSSRAGRCHGQPPVPDTTGDIANGWGSFP